MVPAERLRDLVWSDGGRTAGPATLHGYVAGLRRALEPDRPPRSPSTVLLREGPGYAVRVPAQQVDAERFTALVAHGATMLERGQPAPAVTTLTGALGLWRGPAYADLAEASFVLPEIARLDGLRAAAAESRLTAVLALGRHAEVLGELEALVLEQPLRERGLRLLSAERDGAVNAQPEFGIGSCRSTDTNPLACGPRTRLGFNTSSDTATQQRCHRAAARG